MELLEPTLATMFIEQYKRLLSEVAGKPLGDTADFEKARVHLYENNLNKACPINSEYAPSFVEAIRNAEYGMFIFAKKYRQGYALKSRANVWYFATALSTPLEEFIPDWTIINTAVLPFHGQYVCDGLVVHRQVSIGRNMIHEMIQELKVERAKHSPNKRINY